MHTVDRRLRFTVQEGILAILEMVEVLIGGNTWLNLRRQHLDREPDFFPYEDDHCLCRMARETVHVINLLQPAQVRRFFGFDKRQRRYLCPSCHHECANWDISVTLAQLTPNTAESTNVFCILCRENHEVVRVSCGRNGCRSNVFSPDLDACLTCGRGGSEGRAENPDDGPPSDQPSS